MPSEPGFVNGGMYSRQPNFPSSPVITIDVDDIDATLAEIEGRGGSTVEKKMPVGDMGFAAYFTDTEGNVLGLWQSAG
jgi:predicted enzyme related to lactoylglutathione lyase